MMKVKRMNWQMLVLITCLFSGTAYAQTSGDIQLHIRLRYSDGTAVTDETILLQRLPEEETQACKTSTFGACTWPVRRGLYQLIFERPLDDISSLAVSEGGLRGFGITVGDTSITYHFTFHSDGHVYFDAAPEAAVPAPIIPVGDLLHGGTLPTKTPFPPPHVVEGVTITATPSIAYAAEGDTVVNEKPGRSWQLFLFIAAGLFIGGGLYHWSQAKRNQPPTTTHLSPDTEETKND